MNFLDSLWNETSALPWFLVRHDDRIEESSIM